LRKRVILKGMENHGESLGTERQLVKAQLLDRGLRPQKRWGQHFLTDRGIIRRLADRILADRPRAVLEWGAGLGALTGPLLSAGCPVVAVELDHGLARHLRETWGAAPLTVVEIDALKCRWGAWWKAHGLPAPMVVAGNLPYYITGPLVAQLWEDRELPWQRAVFMMQREAADRLLAEPGTSRAGVPSVLVRTVGLPRRVFDVPAAAFYPMPDVDSTVVEVIRQDSWSPADSVAVKRLVQAGFGQRRKTLRRALGRLVHDDGVWDRAGVDASRRAESLSVEEWRALVTAVRATAGEEGFPDAF
jgi:16S rRNA (adenine1518-N6/adenine1519-N6)-dimethyltransferase